MLRYLILYITILCSVVCGSFSQALAQPSGNDTILVAGIMVDGIIFPMVYMDEVEVIEQMPRKWRRRRARYNRLKHNVYKVYPYATAAAIILKDVDSTLLTFGDDKRARKNYLNDIEAQLKAEFKGEISDLTVSQGHVLVKLIDRQTGKSCYNIIKELQGGVPAVLYQSVGLLFNHNLKKEYDYEGEDKDIEEIVRELEATRNYQYKYQQQQARIKAARKHNKT